MSGGKIIESGQRIIRNSNHGACDEAAVRARFSAFLTRRAPQDTAKAVARGSDTPVATVYKWLNGEAFPNGFAIIRLFRMFGVELILEVFGEEPERLADLVQRAQRRRALVADLAALDRLSG